MSYEESSSAAAVKCAAKASAAACMSSFGPILMSHAQPKETKSAQSCKVFISLLDRRDGHFLTSVETGIHLWLFGARNEDRWVFSRARQKEWPREKVCFLTRRHIYHHCILTKRMKFLICPSLQSVCARIGYLHTGDSVIQGRLEAYSCECHDISVDV